MITHYVKYIVKYGERDRTSLIGANLDTVCKNHNIIVQNVNDWFVSLKNNHVHDEYATLSNVVRELCLCRDGMLELKEFSYGESHTTGSL